MTLARTIALAVLALTGTPALAHASAAPGPAAPAFAPTRISAAILRAEGFDDRSELARAISLRLPGLTLLGDGEPAPPAEPGTLRAFIEVRRAAPNGAAVQINLILADGRAYLREIEVDPDDPARPAASTLANLIAGIEDATAVPDREDVALPPALVAAETPARPPPEPAPERPVPKASPEPTPRPVVASPVPRWQLGPVLHLGGALGLTRPAGPRGVGAGLGLDVRAPSGLLLALDLQWLTRAVDRFHLQRVRVALGVGYVLRRRGFELPIAALVGVEPWWLGDGGGRLPLRSPDGRPGPLLGLGLRLSPGFGAALGTRGAHLRVGARVELWTSGQTTSALHRPELRLPDVVVGLGGAELHLGLEVGVLLPGPVPSRRSKR